MWRTPDGTLHTVALPSPSLLFTDTALDSLTDVLARSGEDELEELIEETEDAVFDLWADRTFEEHVEQAFHAQAAPAGIFTAWVSDRASLVQALEQVDARWRLDVVMAVQDLADAGADD